MTLLRAGNRKLIRSHLYSDSPAGSSWVHILGTRCAGVSGSPGRRGRWRAHWSAACRQPAAEASGRTKGERRREVSEINNKEDVSVAKEKNQSIDEKAVISLQKMTVLLWNTNVFIYLCALSILERSAMWGERCSAFGGDADFPGEGGEMVQRAGLRCLLTRRALLMDLMARRNSLWVCARMCVRVCWKGGREPGWKLLMNYNER